MILIADSGGTKTDWRLINDDGKIDQFKTSGLNPYLTSGREMEETISGLKAQTGEKRVSEIFFYGAGCSSQENVEIISQALSKQFEGAKIEVNHDLLGAARALCGKDAGIACILGTGANSCVYDGGKIIDNIPSLGFILGDEGGGSYLGRILINSYFSGDLPHELSSKLEKRHNMDRDEILESVYQKPRPAQYLASFSKFLYDHQKHPHIYGILYRAFKLFYERNVLKYEGASDYPVHFCGSVAFYYNSLIRQVGKELGLSIQNILESPIAGLTLFHQLRNSEPS